jgi:Zn finger protein HypA/HybF involved in hydrogenase expression
MAAKIPIAQARMFNNVFVCRDCNRRVRTQPTRVIAKKVSCPGCGGHTFRPVRRK